MSDELADFALAEGKETINFHLKNMEAIAKSSNTTLSFLITAGGAAMAAAIKFQAKADTSDLVIPLCSLCVYLFLLAFILVSKCMVARDVYSPGNEPMNIYQPKFNKYDILAVELENLQARIVLNMKRNDETASWLTYIRYGMFISPFIFLTVWVFG